MKDFLDALWVDWLSKPVTFKMGLSTLLLLILVGVVRRMLVRRIRNTEGLSAEAQRRWSVQVRQGVFLLLLLGLLFIWGPELRVFALSVVAIAAAIVIATKELIMCVSGSVLKGAGKGFQVGDRIEIGEIRGDVFDHNWLTTTLYEVGPGKSIHQHTGRKIVLPNSIFLSQAVINESSTNEFVLHVFTVPLKLTDDWTHARSFLLETADEECRTFLEEARLHMEKVGEQQGIRSLSVEPRINVQMPEPDRVNLVVRIPAPARRKGRIEQAILQRFVEHQAIQARSSRERSAVPVGANDTAVAPPSG